MAKISHMLFVTLSGLVLAGAIPQYGQSSNNSPPPPPQAAAPPSYGQSNNNSPPPPPPPPQAAAPPSYASAPIQAPIPAAPAQSASSSSGSSSSGGDLTVQCKASPDGSGKIKYDCSGVNKDAVTLKTEHFLWLENQGASQPNLDIEIPNYNIDEFIRAAYKALGPQEGAKINILLKKPDITYNAAKDEPPAPQVGQPSVSVNYQPVQKVSVHYPTQKQYTSGGPSAPPPGAPSPSNPSPVGPAPGGPAPSAPGAGAYSRPQRESGFRYYFIRQ